MIWSFSTASKIMVRNHSYINFAVYKQFQGYKVHTVNFFCMLCMCGFHMLTTSVFFVACKKEICCNVLCRHVAQRLQKKISHRLFLLFSTKWFYFILKLVPDEQTNKQTNNALELAAAVYVPRSSASGWECWVGASAHTRPSSFPPLKDLTEPGRSRAAGSPHGCLAHKYMAVKQKLDKACRLKASACHAPYHFVQGLVRQ